MDLYVDQSSSKTSLELLQGTVFGDVSWELIIIPEGPWEEQVEMNVTADSLLEESSGLWF